MSSLSNTGSLLRGKHVAGDVIIGATPSIMAIASAEPINDCREQLPRVRPRLLEDYSALTGLVDVALVNGLPPDRPRLVNECLAVERLFAIAPDAFADGPASAKDAGIDARIEPLNPDKLRDTVTSPTSGSESHDDPLPRPNDLSEVHSELVLELHGGLRTGRREVSGGATRPDHGRRHAAEPLGHPSRQP
jgi:DNA-binding transcriptional LysR family regulator